MKTVSRKKFAILVFLLFFGSAGSIPVNAQSDLYSMTDLGNLGGPRIYVVDINDSGQIVGCGDTDVITDGRIWKAFVGTQGGVQSLFNGDNSRSSANSINKAGVIAGYKNGKAFLLGNNGVFTDLGNALDDPLNWGMSVNSAAKVAGYGTGSYDRGVLWENGTSNVYGITDIGNFGGSSTQAASINDSDQIVGFSLDSAGSSRAFRWQRNNGNGSMTPLAVLPSFADSTATRINNKGEAIGYSWKYDSEGNPIVHACLWQNNNLVDLESASNGYSIAYGINEATVVVGVRMVGGEERAFIWDGTNGMRDLNSLIPVGSGLTLSAAYAINNKGQIVGYGQKTGSPNASVFLLTPPPISAPDGPFGIDIDIRPWNFHNQINMHARWELIPVAILSDKDFHAPREVVKKSLKFGPTGNEDSLAFCMPWNWDVNHDGRKDLICYFHEGPTKFQCDDKEGVLKGKTKDGEEFEGRDLVQVVPCKPIRYHR